mgnify:CR=1 FL=1
MILAILAFLLPRLSTHAQRGVDSTLSAGEGVAGSAPGKLGEWLRKPFQKSRNQTNADLLSRIQEGTVGGPILRDKLWFFGAYRKARYDKPVANTFNLPSGPCGVPSVAGAYSLNLTIIGTSGLQGGFLTAWPTGESQPTVSTLNFNASEVVANAAVVPAGTNGSVNVFVTVGLWMPRSSKRRGRSSPARRKSWQRRSSRRWRSGGA